MTVGGDLSEVAAEHELFSVPVPTARSGAKRSCLERCGPARQRGVGQQDNRHSASGPCPAQVSLAHKLHRDQAEDYSECDVKRRRGKPADQFGQGLKRVCLWFFCVLRGTHDFFLCCLTSSRRSGG